MKMEMDAGNSGFFANAKKLTRVVDEELAKTAENVGQSFFSTAKAKTPIDRDGDHPGKLRRGWKIKVKRLGRHGRVAELTNPVEYMNYVEYGHRLIKNGKVYAYVKGKHFMKRVRKTVTREKLPDEYSKMYERIYGRMEK